MKRTLIFLIALTLTASFAVANVQDASMNVESTDAVVVKQLTPQVDDLYTPTLEIQFPHFFSSQAQSITWDANAELYYGIGYNAGFEVYDSLGNLVNSYTMGVNSVRSVWMHGGTVFMKPFGMDLYTIDPTNGNTTVENAGMFNTSNSECAYWDGVIYEHEGGTVWMFDADTYTALGSFTLSGGPNYGYPIATNGEHFFIPTSSSGLEVNVYDMDGNYVESFTISNGNWSWSYSYCNGMFWNADQSGGNWYGYSLGGMVPCCDVDMTPDDDPVMVPPGGSFGLTGYIGNPTADPIVTDVWGGVMYMGSFYQQFSFPNISLAPGASMSAHTSQNVPMFAPAGTYDYVAYCGDRPDEICDEASFPFTVTGARVANGHTEWALANNLFNSEAGISSGVPHQGNDILQAGCCLEIVGPDDSWTFATSDVEVGPYVVYDNFECPNITELNDLQWWGVDLQYQSGWFECSEDPMDFHIGIYEDSGNQPGAELCSYDVTVTPTYTGIMYGGSYELVEYGATLSPACMYNEGWVSVQGTSAYGDSCVFLWGNSFDGDSFAYQDQGGTLVPLSYDLSKCFNGGGPPPCCDVDMTPDEDPVIVEPGGSFGLTGYIGNPTDAPIVTDVWVGVMYEGMFFQQIAFNNIPLDVGESLTAHTNQNVPGFAPVGTYEYVAYCGDRPDEICDMASFPFTVVGQGALTVGIVLADYDDAHTAAEDLLMQSGMVGLVQAVDARNSTPTLDDLMAFDVCLVWSNYNFADPIAMGDVLADYIDAGGAAVVCEFAYYSGWAMGGRYMTDFSPLTSTVNMTYSDVDIVVDDPGHPIMDGVASGSGYFVGEPSFNGNTHMVQSFANGYNGCTVNTDYPQCVGINNYFGTQYASWTGDVGQMMVNAVLFAASNAPGIWSGDWGEWVDYLDVPETAPSTARAGSSAPATTLLRGEGSVPANYALDEAYPNPFNAQTNITFGLPEAGNVNLTVYNLMGQEVATLANGEMEAGYHTVTWNASDVSSGIYFYKLTAGDRVFTKKMSLLK
ncbi:MAG: T9SS type A sorting domain-containing protein [candidate division Zixibacteria bacterium]|nr:T9SS type A sorting domain-containing protein [candidate division Zixibacteria bacterium]